ncbi:hypothetical protein SULPSESMR1_02438 [Pseudosulfitobacter pseudonitzschiae]|uniref:Uncharacterized protein n=1 Tax=Pseudosulfitobacter pseudonitzschiae TaxID=1402135 RepID=A0A221K2N0_9RHOB|nr:hypothetical protein SULPSESMR1_02438 [Pseudosulfitobacter pseudonitzschiae]
MSILTALTDQIDVCTTQRDPDAPFGVDIHQKRKICLMPPRFMQCSN